MSKHRYEPSLFDRPVHVIPLGHIHVDGDQALLTLGDIPGGARHGFLLTSDQRELLQSLDPAANAQDLPLDKKGPVWWMGNEGMVALIPEDAQLSTLDLVPVVREPLTVDAEIEGGYRIGVGNGEAIDVSLLASEFLFHMDGRRSLAEIAEAVRNAVLASDEWRAEVARIEQAEGADLETLLARAALSLLVLMQPAGAATFDRAA